LGAATNIFQNLALLRILQGEVMRFEENNQSGFTLIEVAVASFITMGGLVFLAGLFTLAMAQNRMIKQYTTTVSLAQEKLEELNAIETSDDRLLVGGGLDEGTKQDNYFDALCVDPETGQVTPNCAASSAIYR
jgi:hypothetical protein